MQKACMIYRPPTCIYFSLLKNRPELLHATESTRAELLPINSKVHEENLWKVEVNPCAQNLIGKWERQHSFEIKKLRHENGHLYRHNTESIENKLVRFQQTVTCKGRRHVGPCISAVNNRQLPLGGYLPMTTTTFNHVLSATSRQHRYYSSSIFISGRGGTASAGFDFDDDLEDRLKDVERLKAELILRGTKIDVDKLVEDYKHYMELKAEKELWEAQREDIAQKIATIVKAQKESKVKTNVPVDSVNLQQLSEEGKAKKLALKDLLPRFWDIVEKVMLTAVSLPTSLAEKVPELYQVIDEYYTDNKPVEAVDHYEILKQSNMVKLSNVGNKAYYLRGRIAELEQELIRHFCQELRSKNITQMLAPEMFKTPVVEAGGLDVLDPNIIYRLLHKQETKMLYNYDFDHMFLRGASHLSFLAYFAKSLLRTQDLPVSMFVVGRSYQPETGLSKDLPGLLGALQSTKICMCGVTGSQEKNKELSEEFVATLYSVYRQYELPYRMVSAPSWALSGMERNRTEFQIWVPSMQQYLRIGSVSECGDYNSRRLMIRASDNGKPSTSYPVFMVHSDATDITKMIGLLLEYKKTDTYWILPDPLKDPPSDDTPDTEDAGRLSEDIADYIT